MTSTPLNMTTTSSTRKISFRDLYIEHREQPTPVQTFVNEVARITDSSPNTVRAWRNGTQVPERIKQRQIAEHFGVDIESLFPNVKNADNDENS